MTNWAMLAFLFVLESLVLILGFSYGFHEGYALGVADTEERWADAVARKEAHENSFRR